MYIFIFIYHYIYTYIYIYQCIYIFTYRHIKQFAAGSGLQSVNDASICANCEVYSRPWHDPWLQGGESWSQQQLCP